MAHYAFLDENNIVTEVIGGIDETELIEGLDPEIWYGNLKGQICKRTSYSNSYRYNYAGIGYTFDPVADAFHAPDPKCHDERILDLTTYRWTCANSDHLDHDVRLPE